MHANPPWLGLRLHTSSPFKTAPHSHTNKKIGPRSLQVSWSLVSWSTKRPWGGGGSVVFVNAWVVMETSLIIVVL